jgi:hypothetical protein
MLVNGDMCCGLTGVETGLMNARGQVGKGLLFDARGTGGVHSHMAVESVPCEAILDHLSRA